MIIETKKGDLHIRYGWSALAKFGDMAGLSMDKVLELDMAKMKLSDMLCLILVGFEDGARKEGVECQFKNIEELGDYIDDDPSIVEKAVAALGEMSKGKDKGSKKK